MSAMEDTKFATRLSALMERYGQAVDKVRNHRAVVAYRKFKTTSARILHPDIVGELMKFIPKSELDWLNRESARIIKTKTISNNWVVKKGKVTFSKEKLVVDQDTLKEQKSQYKTLMNSQGKYTPLSSSWLKLGAFNLTNEHKQLGILTVMISSDKHPKWYGAYVYPNVPAEVWIMMTRATGKNGGGAGTVFWNYYLHSFYPSALRAYVKKKLKKQTHGEIWKRENEVRNLDAPEIRELQTMMKDFQKNFFRTKQASKKGSFNKEWYQARNSAKRNMTHSIRKDASRRKIRVIKAQKMVGGWQTTVKVEKTRIEPSFYGQIKGQKRRAKQQINKALRPWKYK